MEKKIKPTNKMILKAHGLAILRLEKMMLTVCNDLDKLKMKVEKWL